jgi:hypothetical protein
MKLYLYQIPGGLWQLGFGDDKPKEAVATFSGPDAEDQAKQYIGNEFPDREWFYWEDLSQI